MQENEKFSFKRMAKTFAGTVLVGGMLLYGIAKKTDLLDSSIDVNIQGKEGVKKLEVPVYNLIKLKPGRCSGYTRRAAEEIFDKDYSFSNAWDREYKDNKVCDVNNNQELEVLADEGILKPGMILGVYSPGSPYLDGEDMKGEEIDYTHNMVYLGESPKGNPLFADQFKMKTRVSTLEDITNQGLEVKTVINTRD